MTTPDQADARWQQLADAELCGEPLAPHELEFLATHVAHDPAVRSEQQIRRALADHGREDLVDPAADERLISAALARVYPQPRRRPQTPPRLWLGAGVLLAAGLALVWTLRPPSNPPPTPLTILTGAPHLQAGEPVPGDSLTGELATADEPACVGAPGRVRACLGPHSRARVAPDGALELLAGDIDVDITPASEVTRFILQVAGVRLTSDDAAFAVTVTSHTWTAKATRGAVAVSDADGPLARLGPGDRWTRGDEPIPAPVPQDIPSAPVPKDIPASEPVPASATTGPDIPAEPVPTDSPQRTTPRPDAPPPAELLAEAREHRAAGRVREAVRAYQRLVAAHPGSPLAGTAELALGQLYLGPAADPKAALKAFDRYLAHDGPLAEEAAHGRISALTRLGRHADARAAIERFLTRYPASSYADALRRQTTP